MVCEKSLKKQCNSDYCYHFYSHEHRPDCEYGLHRLGQSDRNYCIAKTKCEEIENGTV